MGLGMKTALWLREQGHDAVHLREEGLQRMPDPEIFAKARTEGRILLTMDLGFGSLLAASGSKLPSVIIFRQSNRRSDTINTLLVDVLSRYGPEFHDGAVISVTDSSIRIRRLPIA
jgi:predicted nuclease of predicted toxin-antitoxin system